MTGDDLEKVAIPGCNGVVRDNPIIKGQIDPLGFVGNAFRIFQNEESCDLLDAIVDEACGVDAGAGKARVRDEAAGERGIAHARYRRAKGCAAAAFPSGFSVRMREAISIEGRTTSMPKPRPASTSS
jgi:hypothetical protein